MKAKDFLKKYAAARSMAKVVANIYNRETGETETSGLTTFEVEHFGEMDWPLAKSTLESFEIFHDFTGGRIMLRINVSI